MTIPRKTVLTLTFLLIPVAFAAGDEKVPEKQEAQQASGAAPEPEGGKLVPLNKEKTVLLDAANKKLIVHSEVALREGMLEMLLCKRHTKEHESILAYEGRAYIIHAGLVALGLDPGTPVSFDPKYKPPTGPELKMEVVWTGDDGKERRRDARKWIRYSINRFFGEPLEALPAGLVLPEDSDLRYDATNKELSWYGPMTAKQRDDLLALSENAAYRKAIKSFFTRSQPREMDAVWVFAGSTFAVDENGGTNIYLAESGDVICVANFPSALIDISKRSSPDGQESLLFEAWTERIPPVGTDVRLEIIPVAKKPAARNDARENQKARPSGVQER